jgi:hypothetical protein
MAWLPTTLWFEEQRMSATQDVTVLPAQVTLLVNQWNQVMEVLSGQPWKEINPVLVEIHRQLHIAVNAHTHQPPLELVSRSVPGE